MSQPPPSPQAVLLKKVQGMAAPYGLMEMGGLQSPPDAPAQTHVLIGTAPDFWQRFIASPEYTDGAPDALDRWSLRVIPLIANAAEAIDVAYPFGGPPYAPFITWAKASGQAFDSPTGMVVHNRAGLMISYRGALIFEGHWSLPAPSAHSPCDQCTDRPCIPACPIGALSDTHFYDVPACKAHIRTPQGTPCMTYGCATRLACPVSQSFNRPTEQTAFHMRAFKGN